MLQSVALAAFMFSRTMTVWHIGLLAAAQAIINAFDMPGRQSFLLTMIEDKKDLANAIALNSSMVNAARLVGPSIAGIIIAATSEGWCFLIDGISYMAVIVSLLKMVFTPGKTRATARRGSGVQQFKEGFAYAFGFKPVRSIILLLALVSLVGIPYSVLMPVFAVNVFGVANMSRAALPVMRAAGHGAVVNTCSVVASVGLVDRAVQRGLVQRDVSRDDARVVRVSLTAKGRRLVGQIGEEVSGLITPMTRSLTPAEQKRLGILLNRVLGR